MVVSAVLKFTGKNHWALFVGQWAAPFLSTGNYNKMVKQHGSDAYSKAARECSRSIFDPTNLIPTNNPKKEESCITTLRSSCTRSTSTPPTSLREYAPRAIRRRNGELAAAMQYSIQGLNCEDPDARICSWTSALKNSVTWRSSVALARLHLKPMKKDRDAAEADPLVAIAGGGGVTLCNSMGDAWTADYLKDNRRA